MYTVATLIAALAELPADVPVHTVIVERCGHYADHHRGVVGGVDINLDDHGQITGIWLTATPASSEVPAVITIGCECGQPLIVDDTNPWPDEHRWCHRPSTPLPPPSP